MQRWRHVNLNDRGVIIALSTRVTFEMEYSTDKARYCHRVSWTIVQSCVVETFSSRSTGLECILARPTEVPVTEIEMISVDRAGSVPIWPRWNFYEGNSWRARSRSTGPKPGSFEKVHGHHTKRSFIGQISVFQKIRYETLRCTPHKLAKTGINSMTVWDWIISASILWKLELDLVLYVAYLFVEWNPLRFHKKKVKSFSQACVPSPKHTHNNNSYFSVNQWRFGVSYFSRSYRHKLLKRF